VLNSNTNAVTMGKTKVLIFNASKSSLTDLHFHYKGVEIEITTTYTYLGVQFTGPCFSSDMPFCLGSVKGTVPWPSSRDNASWVNFRTSCPNSTSWRQLSDPWFCRSCYRQSGPSWMGSRLYFSCVSSAASEWFCNPLFR
jgi:hypothetical protein